MELGQLGQPQHGESDELPWREELRMRMRRIGIDEKTMLKVEESVECRENSQGEEKKSGKVHT